MHPVGLVDVRLVPTAPPTWREAWLPVLLTGTAIGLLTSLFSVLAPLLVGGLAAFGVLAAVFGAFVWLNLSFQLLLWGAAWTRFPTRPLPTVDANDRQLTTDH